MNFGPDDRFPLSSKERTKANWDHIVEDIQQALKDCDYSRQIELVFLYECSGVTRVEISRDEIIYSEPTSWKRVKGADDHYIGDSCYDKPYRRDA